MRDLILAFLIVAAAIWLIMGDDDAEVATQKVVSDRGAESAKLREAFCAHRPTTCAAEVHYLKSK